MKVNRFGKRIFDLGYKNIPAFLKANDIDISHDTFYTWCTKSVTPTQVHTLVIDKLAGILDCNRVDLLNMMASKPTFEVKVKYNDGVKSLEQYSSILSQKRAELGFTAKELAELIGLDNPQTLTDIEHGRRKAFPDSKVLEAYLEALSLSFTEFQRIILDLYNDHLKKQRERRQAEKPTEDKWERVYNADLPEIESKPDKLSDAISRMYDIDDAAYETKPVKEIIKDAMKKSTIDRVLNILYGKVEFEVFNQIQDILRGAL